MNRRNIARNVQKGFTLIELMIVVAIISILAAIAIPQYQTYVAKSQVSRVVAETGDQKTAVEDCINNGQLKFGAATSADTCGGTATGSNLLVVGDGNTVNGVPPTSGGAPVLAITATGGATLQSNFGGAAAAALTGAYVRWTRLDTDGTWTCSTTVDPKYASNACPAAVVAGGAAAGG